MIGHAASSDCLRHGRATDDSDGSTTDRIVARGLTGGTQGKASFLY